MFTQTHKHLFLFAAILVLVALTSSACGFSGVRVSPTSPMVDIVIHQEQLDHSSMRIRFNFNDACGVLLDGVKRVELHDGYIRYLGYQVQPDGSKAYGSIDVSLGAEQDVLKAEIVAVDLPGMDLSDPCIRVTNREIEEELSGLVSLSPAQVLFKFVEVKEGSLRMKIKVNIDDIPSPSF